MAVYATNVSAESMLIPNMVKLSWTNPTDPSFSRVVVFRRSDQFQTDPTSPYGIQIYSGTATTVYDYWVDGSKVPQSQKSYPNIAADNLNDFLNLRASSNTHPLFNQPAENILTAGQLYYYTVFAVDTNNNYYATSTQMVTARPIEYNGWDSKLWNMLPAIYRQSDTGANLDPTGKGYGQLQRLLWLLSLAYEFTQSKAKNQTNFLSIDRAEPYQLPYIARYYGWDLDPSLPLASQKISLRQAINIYRMAGTRKGLDVLVKLYSGFPTTSGVSEASTLVLDAPIFSGNQVYLLDRVVPDFGIPDPTTAPTTSFGTGSVGPNLVANTGYQYQIVAYDPASDSTYKYGTGYTNPSPNSAIITESSTVKPIVVSWTPITGAGGYLLYRNGKFLKDVGNVTSYTDTGNDTPQNTPALPTSNQTGMNFSQVGQALDPIKYCYDFSASSKTNSNRFSAYVQPTYTLTSDQVTSLQTKLKGILDKFVPTGVSYTINIYN